MSSRASRLAAPALGLKEFMRRSQVIQQYRCFLRALRAYGRREPTTAAELREQVCRAFRRHRDEADASLVRVLLRDGERQLAQVRALAAPGGEGGDARAAHGADSWINNSDPDDVRGRVGAQWPWGSS